MNIQKTTVVLFLFFVSMCQAEDWPVRLVWDHDGENTAGYRIYTSLTSGGPFEVLLDVPVRNNGTPVEVKLPLEATTYVVVTAYSIAGLESLPSDELVVPLFRPSKPTNLIIPAQILSKGVTIMAVPGTQGDN